MMALALCASIPAGLYAQGKYLDFDTDKFMTSRAKELLTSLRMDLLTHHASATESSCLVILAVLTLVCHHDRLLEYASIPPVLDGRQAYKVNSSRRRGIRALSPLLLRHVLPSGGKALLGRLIHPVVYAAGSCSTLVRRIKSVLCGRP